MKKQKPKSPPARYARTQDELADAMGISRQEINQKWMKRPGFPPKTPHGWKLESVMSWYADALRAVTNKPGSSTPLSEVRRDKILKEIEKLDLELARLRGENEKAILSSVKSALAQVARYGIDQWDIQTRNAGAMSNDARLVEFMEAGKKGWMERMQKMEVTIE